MKHLPFALRVSIRFVVAALLPACTQHTHGNSAVPHAGTDRQASPVEDASALGPSPDDALRRLQEGSARFVRGETRHPHEARSWRAGLEAAQHPFAAVIGCSDSRVPLELIFDQGFGDLFVIRVAGNLIGLDEAGTIEYAVVHLHTPIVAVIGHQSCGAVTAALASHEEITRQPHELSGLLANIHVGIPEIPHSVPRDQRVARGVEANVRHAMDQLWKVPSIRNAAEAGQIRIVGGIYILKTGEVRWLEHIPRE